MPSSKMRTENANSYELQSDWETLKLAIEKSDLVVTLSVTK